MIAITDKTGKVTAVTIRIWFAKNKPKSCVNTSRKLLSNMINGVTRGYKYVMKFGYKIFRMQPVAEDGGKMLKIVKLLGDSYIRRIKAVEGCTISVSTDTTKKEIYVSGCDPAAVGQTCAMINQSCRAKNVDKRIFLDGIHIFARKFQDE